MQDVRLRFLYLYAFILRRSLSHSISLTFPSALTYFAFYISISVAHAFCAFTIVLIIILKIRSLFHSWYIYYLCAVYIRYTLNQQWCTDGALTMLYVFIPVRSCTSCCWWWCGGNEDDDDVYSTAILGVLLVSQAQMTYSAHSVCVARTYLWNYCHYYI